MKENDSLLKKILKSFTKQEGLDDLLTMSEHCNGYKRENAVRRLGMLGNPVAIPKLIARVNDWVPQVRNAARESLEKLLKNENAEAFIYSLPYLYHLKNCGRDDHKILIEKITNFLLKPENNSYIKSAIKNDDPNIARIAIKLCIENPLIDKHELVSECLSHSDVIVRIIASNLLNNFTGEILESFLRKAIQDQFMPIRREAFQIYLKSFPAQGLNLAKNFLFDKHISIREIAIKNLLKTEINVEKILSNTLSSADQNALKTRCAILGLAYLDAKQSVPIIINFATHRVPSIKKATLQALAKLISEESRSYLLEGVKDEYLSVAKESAYLLNKLNMNLSVDELLAITEITHYPHTLIVCISASRKINKWDRLIFILSLYKLSILKNSANAKILDKELSHWDLIFNCSSQQPSQTQVERLNYEYNQFKLLFSEGRFRSLLDFTMKGYGIYV